MLLNDKNLFETLTQLVKKGNCFTEETRDVLIAYKNSGGQKEMAQQILAQLKQDYQHNEVMQDGIDDILDIVTGWSSPHMRVW